MTATNIAPFFMFLSPFEHIIRWLQAFMPALIWKKNGDNTTMNKILNRVPEITIFFWIIKILATTVGETAADFLSEKLGLGLTVTSY